MHAATYKYLYFLCYHFLIFKYKDVLELEIMCHLYWESWGVSGVVTWQGEIGWDICKAYENVTGQISSFKLPEVFLKPQPDYYTVHPSYSANGNLTPGPGWMTMFARFQWIPTAVILLTVIMRAGGGSYRLVKSRRVFRNTYFVGLISEASLKMEKWGASISQNGCLLPDQNFPHKTLLLNRVATATIWLTQTRELLSSERKKSLLQTKRTF